MPVVPEARPMKKMVKYVALWITPCRRLVFVNFSLEMATLGKAQNLLITALLSWTSTTESLLCEKASRTVSTWRQPQAWRSSSNKYSKFCVMCKVQKRKKNFGTLGCWQPFAIEALHMGDSECQPVWIPGTICCGLYFLFCNQCWDEQTHTSYSVGQLCSASCSSSLVSNLDFDLRWNKFSGLNEWIFSLVFWGLLCADRLINMYIFGGWKLSSFQSRATTVLSYMSWWNLGNGAALELTFAMVPSLGAISGADSCLAGGLVGQALRCP